MPFMEQIGLIEVDGDWLILSSRSGSRVMLIHLLNPQAPYLLHASGTFKVNVAELLVNEFGPKFLFVSSMVGRAVAVMENFVFIWKIPEAHDDDRQISSEFALDVGFTASCAQFDPVGCKMLVLSNESNTVVIDIVTSAMESVKLHDENLKDISCGSWTKEGGLVTGDTHGHIQMWSTEAKVIPRKYVPDI